MKRFKIHFQENSNNWNITLLVLVVFEIFLIPFFPITWHRVLYAIAYTFIYLAASFAVARNRKWLKQLAVTALLFQWGCFIFNLAVLIWISSVVNVVFFCLIVIDIIRQLVRAPTVSVRVILESIIAYLLVGLTFVMLITLVMAVDSGAFSFARIITPDPGHMSHISEYIYFTFITMCTVGYGDIIPLEPYSRSITILISVTGQLYIAIIIAILVGKYSSQIHYPSE